MEQNLVNLRNWVEKHRKHGHHTIHISDIIFEIDSEIENVNFKNAQQINEEKLNSGKKEKSASPSGKPTGKGGNA